MNYRLNNIRVTTVGDASTFNCSHKAGEGFLCNGENLSFLPGTKRFSHFVLASLMPYIAAKQRVRDKADWMQSETDIACPDPKCGAKFQFEIVGKSMYEYHPRSNEV